MILKSFSVVSFFPLKILSNFPVALPSGTGGSLGCDWSIDTRPSILLACRVRSIHRLRSVDNSKRSVFLLLRAFSFFPLSLFRTHGPLFSLFRPVTAFLWNSLWCRNKACTTDGSPYFFGSHPLPESRVERCVGSTRFRC